MINLQKRLRLPFTLMLPFCVLVVMMSTVAVIKHKEILITTQEDIVLLRKGILKMPQDVPEFTNIGENLTSPLFEYINRTERLPSFIDKHQVQDPPKMPSTFSIPAKSICLQQSYTLLILIPSTFAGSDRRQAIRQTWAKSVYHDIYEENQTQDVRLAFFFGDTLLNSDEIYKLQQESSTYNDIVVANFHDTYRNLSLKMAIAISWADKYCGEAQYIMKVDDDVYLNIELLLNFLHRLPKEELYFSLGFKNINSRPPVLRKGKWGNSKTDYPFDYYPSYVVGYAYVLSRLAVQNLSANFHRFHFFANEDAFINGVLCFSLNITRLCSKAFASPLISYNDCDVVYNKYITFVVDYKKMPSISESVRSKTCSRVPVD